MAKSKKAQPEHQSQSQDVNFVAEIKKAVNSDNMQDLHYWLTRHAISWMNYQLYHAEKQFEENVVKFKMSQNAQS